MHHENYRGLNRLIGMIGIVVSASVSSQPRRPQHAPGGPWKRLQRGLASAFSAVQPQGEECTIMHLFASVVCVWCARNGAL